MSNYHEPAEELSAHARDISRALVSLKEEIEAVDWYNQRIDASKNEDLKRILHHNMVEEMEHACMTLEWLRKNMAGWEDKLREELFTDKRSDSDSPDLSIGKIK